MKCFAITPDGVNAETLARLMPGLRQQGVSHVYLRTQSLHADPARLIALFSRHAIMPIIPRSLYQSAFAGACGVHTRAAEQFQNVGIPCLVQTASCHNAPQACTLLDSGADYVFISPVYRPGSKPGDRRPLIPADDLRMLSRRYGERIALLGGITPARIDELRRLLDTDFSVAGISMFFSTGTADDTTPPADIYK